MDRNTGGPSLDVFGVMCSINQSLGPQPQPQKHPFYVGWAAQSKASVCLVRIDSTPPTRVEPVLEGQQEAPGVSRLVVFVRKPPFFGRERCLKTWTQGVSDMERNQNRTLANNTHSHLDQQKRSNSTCFLQGISALSFATMVGLPFLEKASDSWWSENGLHLKWGCHL